jgi:hypothetical protein
MACDYFTGEKGCGALFDVKISDGVAHFCAADYHNCPRYQFVNQQKDDKSSIKQGN